MSAGRQRKTRPSRRGWHVIAAGLVLATASIAAATASSYDDRAQPPARASGNEWRSLAIAPIAEGSRTGRRAAPQGNVEPLAFKPERPAPRPSIPVAVSQPLDAEPLRFTGLVGADLYASLRAAGVADSVSDDYVRALATRVDLSRGLGTADRFDLVVEDRKLHFAGLDRVGAADVLLMRWTVGGKLDWVDAGGIGTRSAGMAWPVPARVSSSFGMRMHPILGFFRFHRGIDLKASWGAPIVAAADGRIAAAGWAGGHGRQVRIAHAGGLTTSYSHMSRIAAAPGQAVRQGQLIGYVGSSGLSTGPHLHYEVFKDGRPVNPATVRFASVSKIGEADRLAFRARLRQLLLVKPSEA